MLKSVKNHQPQFNKMVDVKILSITKSRYLAEKIADYYGQPVGDLIIDRFSDGEMQPIINESVRGGFVFFIASTFQPHDNLIELLLAIDAAKRASAGYITAVIPYFGYARQDRKTDGRTPISAKLVANLICTAGADRVLTVDLHAGQIQGFFDVPTDNLFAVPVIEKDIKERYNGDKMVVVSPDVGGVVRARALAKRIGADLAIVDKRRPEAGKSEVMNIIGDVDGYRCIMIDDICDSGGTLCNAAAALKDQGAIAVSAYVTHGVLSNNAVGRVEKSVLDELVICDTIQPGEDAIKSKSVRILPMAPLLGEAIRRIANEESVSKLFD